MLQENSLLEELREPVITGKTMPESWRKLQLGRINSLLENHENEIIKALGKDLGKPPTEAFFEIVALRQELKLVKKNSTKRKFT